MGIRGETADAKGGQPGGTAGAGTVARPLRMAAGGSVSPVFDRGRHGRPLAEWGRGHLDPAAADGADGGPFHLGSRFPAAIGGLHSVHFSAGSIAFIRTGDIAAVGNKAAGGGKALHLCLDERHTAVFGELAANFPAHDRLAGGKPGEGKYSNAFPHRGRGQQPEQRGSMEQRRGGHVAAGRPALSHRHGQSRRGDPHGRLQPVFSPVRRERAPGRRGRGNTPYSP